MIVQETVEISTSVIFVLSAILSAFLTANYNRIRKSSFIFWSAGMWTFSVAVFLEIVFSAGIFSQDLIKVYLFLVAELVLLLSLGSMILLHSKYGPIYYIYSAVISIYLVLSLYLYRIGNIINSYVVFGSLPLQVVLSSSLVTFPAAVMLVLIAILTYRKTRDKKMISIIAGVIVVSVAGTLYIASFPAFLYFAEFIGILLLWAGFFDPSMIRKNTRVKGK